MRPRFSAWNDFMQIAHHLAAVAYAERKAIGASEKRLELVARPAIEQYRLGPALARSQYVAVGKSAARGESLESGQADTPGNDVAHVHVEGVEPGALKRRCHFDLTVDSLLTQHRDARPRHVHERGRDVGRCIESQMRRDARVFRIEDAREFLLRALRIVAQTLHLERRF